LNYKLAGFRLIAKVLLGSELGAVLIGAMLLLSALPFTGHVEPSQIQTDTERLSALKEIQDQSIDTAKPMRIQVGVDYREGESGAWIPKGEVPVLAQMVADGTLPPVAERVALNHWCCAAWTVWASTAATCTCCATPAAPA